jgi:ATP-binding cassette subfamily B protein
MSPPAQGLPEIGTIALIRRLLADYGLTQWRRYALAFVFMGISAGATALMAYLIGTITNQAYLHRDFKAVVIICLGAVAMMIGKGLATYGQAVIMSRIGNHIIAQNQRLLFDRLMQHSLGFFSERHSSEFMARLGAGASAATQVLNMVVMALGRDILTLIGLAAVMVMQDPMLSLLVFVVSPPAALILRKITRRVRAIARSQWDSGRQLMETLQETVVGIRIVKTFTLEDELRARYFASVAQVEKQANKLARVANRSSPIMEALGGIAVAAGLAYAAYRSIVTGSTPGEFFSFITAFLLAAEPAKRLARLNLDLNAALVGVRVLFELIDAPLTEPDDRDRPALRPDVARVEFKDVNFSYVANQPVLRNLSLIANAGKITALVGPSGGGKSTIFNLILRLYDPQSGAIVIGNQTIADVSRRSLRQQIAYVGQEIFLFRGSIRDNIASGKSGATEEEVIAAAKAANAHDFIMSLPGGYDSPVGEHGLKLSGGQRQRVAIARALIKNAPLILLDEATASLDSESERLVRDAINHLMKDRTTIAIAHRLHTVAHADQIYVIENGMVSESGRHDELLRKGGRYATFYRLQLKDQEEAPLPAAAAG